MATDRVFENLCLRTVTTSFVQRTRDPSSPSILPLARYFCDLKPAPLDDLKQNEHTSLINESLLQNFVRSHGCMELSACYSLELGSPGWDAVTSL